MTEIVFIVDDFDSDGVVLTAMDRIKAISDNWQPNLFEKNKRYYQAFTGNKIKFVKKSDITSYDKDKKYLYFIPINDWHCTKQIFFNILDKKMQHEFATNGVGFYFCQDFEMYPNQNINYFGNYLAWLLLCQMAHSFPEIPIYIAMCSQIAPRYLDSLKHHFGDRLKFVSSPLIIVFAREELAAKLGQVDINSHIEQYLNTPKKKMYMALTRDPKYHRLTMMHGLRANGLLDDGYVSNLITREYSPSSIDSQSDYAKAVAYDMQNLLPRMEVDKVNEDLIPGIFAGIGGDIPTNHMITSCYDLVQETATNYEGELPIDMAVITEKVTKSLLFGRPFMINGGEGCLGVLKKWGFATYDNLFDESYDDKVSFVDRQEVIVKNVLKWKGRHTDFMNAVRGQETMNRMFHNVSRVINFPIEDLLVTEIFSA